MPLTVITMKNAPASLRGDLSKWMQEIATGVYVGNFNSRIREQIWNRVIESVGNGEATMSYSYRNEIGYQFATHNTNRQVVDYDGIPLVQIPIEAKAEPKRPKKGFSVAAKNHQARLGQRKQATTKPLVIFDIETTGLNEKRDQIIEIAAVKIHEASIEPFHRLVNVDKQIPAAITDLTGITNQILSDEGVSIASAIQDFKLFIENTVLVGYNINFDLKFINAYLNASQQPVFNNKTQDLMKIVKKDNMFLNNYKLPTVLKSYDIMDEVVHRAQEDVVLYLKLMSKLNKFDHLNIEKLDLDGIF
ncbi:type I-E CRISPR-associated endoribonuclease Cas2 [Aerococcus urinaehominis]|uniref:DNA polymerase III polC-type n=1 Tax=Aerococcus urinaehominis TaxID=128944 RepID=A0A0X8FMF8_9LACT|nr:type I-E CRISPR-associated endoribonuclease Cas2e [Aerococcus urinaehominis]AMB99975.1 type I-E CRISPR-associated endoribonuclease Cas2 [Aerococcus urinaehominis]SDM45281.1 CRISPR-associated protein Cas2 [Aerococcus urinaehominis]